jgi:hypothetical protein
VLAFCSRFDSSQSIKSVRADKGIATDQHPAGRQSRETNEEQFGTPQQRCAGSF